MLKAVAKEKVAKPNLMIRSAGKTRNVMTVARKAIHHPTAMPRNRKRQRKTMITSQELAQLAALRSCAKT